MIHENGKEYVVSTDEGSMLGGATCQARRRSRITDISDERNPVVVATMKPDSSKPENCQQNIKDGSINGMVTTSISTIAFTQGS
jgi:hypothetical protein